MRRGHGKSTSELQISNMEVKQKDLEDETMTGKVSGSWSDQSLEVKQEETDERVPKWIRSIPRDEQILRMTNENRQNIMPNPTQRGNRLHPANDPVQFSSLLKSKLEKVVEQQKEFESVNTPPQQDDQQNIVGDKTDAAEEGSERKFQYFRLRLKSLEKQIGTIQLELSGREVCIADLKKLIEEQKNKSENLGFHMIKGWHALGTAVAKQKILEQKHMKFIETIESLESSCAKKDEEILNLKSEVKDAIEVINNLCESFADEDEPVVPRMLTQPEVDAGRILDLEKLLDQTMTMVLLTQDELTQVRVGARADAARMVDLKEELNIMTKKLEIYEAEPKVKEMLQEREPILREHREVGATQSFLTTFFKQQQLKEKNTPQQNESVIRKGASSQGFRKFSEEEKNQSASLGARLKELKDTPPAHKDLKQYYEDKIASLEIRCQEKDAEIWALKSDLRDTISVLNNKNDQAGTKEGFFFKKTYM